MVASRSSLLCFTLLMISGLSHSLCLSNFRTLFSISHSLTSRVAALRAARGDMVGADRARLLAHHLERGLGLGFYKLALYLGWDYIKNYAWRDAASFASMGGVLADLKQLSKAFVELNCLNSDAERAAWAARNYKNVLTITNSLFTKLLEVFRQSGPLREVVLVLRKEVLEGGLLWDCLELGAGDVKGLVQILKDIALQYASSYPKTEL